MRALAACACAVLVGGPARAEIALVQADGGNSNGSLASRVVAGFAPTGAGHTGVVVLVYSYLAPGSSIIASVTDNAPGGSSAYSFVTTSVTNLNDQIELWVTPPGASAPERRNWWR